MNQPTVTIPSNSQLVSSFRTYSRGAGSMCVLVGASVLVGWLLDIPFLKSVIPGLFAMKVNAALCFILAGVALGLLENEAANATPRRIAQACAAMVSLIGLLTLSEYLFGWDLGIDQLLIEEPLGTVGTSHPGRMAPNLAASFVLIGLAMLLLDVETCRCARPAEFLALVTATISFLALIGYLFSVQSLRGIASYTDMALHAAFAVFILSTGVFLARPDRGWTAIITRDGPGGGMARRLLPFVIGIPLLLGWLLRQGDHTDSHLHESGFALFVVVIVLIFSVLAIWNASVQNSNYKESLQAEQAIRQRVQEMQSLHEIGQTIINSVDLHTVLDSILEKALTLGAFDIGVIRLLNATGKSLTVASSRGYRESERIRPLGTDPKDPTIGRAQTQVFESRGAYIVESVPTSKGFRTFKAEGVESAIVVPIRAGGEIIGTMQLGSRTPRTFKPEEVHLFDAIGHPLGIAVQKTKLHEANQQAFKEIEALYAVTTSATQSLNLNTVLQMVIRKITEIFAFDATRVFLFDSSMQTLLLKAAHETSTEKFVGNDSFRRGQGIVGRAAEAGTPIIFEDIQNDPKYLEMSYLGNTRKMGGRFFAAFPIMSKRQTLGVISFCEHKPRSLAPTEIGLLTAMAGQIGIAVENARLFEETYQRADELTQKTLELEKSSRAKDEFLAMISHELRTPLNVIMGYTGLLQEGMLGALNPQQDDALKKVALQSNDLLSIVSNLLRATQIGSGEIKAERARTDLGQLLDEIKNAYDLPATNELTLNWDFPSDLLIVETDSEKLRHILGNLIHNAIKFTEKGSVTIAARHLPKSKTLRVTVADTGPGIAKESLPIIFDMFHQVDGSNTRSHGGLGLGLYIVKKYTELLGGKIKVKSATGRGSVFTVALPYESSLCRGAILSTVTPESRIADPWVMER